MTRTAEQAAAWARVPRVGYGGMCLKHARMAWGVPAKYGHARLAWQQARFRHPTTSLAGIPVGAPIFLDRASSKYGHVATYLGNGQMGTTDSAKRTTQVVPVQSWLNAGWRLLGWTEDLNGVKLPIGSSTTSPPSPPPAPSGVLQVGSTGPAVKALQGRLNRDYPAYSKLVADGVFGAATERVVREFQRRSNLAVDGVAGPATLAKLGL